MSLAAALLMRTTLCLSLVSALLGGAACQLDEVESVASSDQAALTAPPGTTKVVLIRERDVTWRYNDSGVAPPVSWRIEGQVGTSDGFSGPSPGPLGYGEPYLQTVVGYGPDASNRYITTYFRKQFGIDPDEIRALHLRAMYDDGFVAYIDGQEVLRVGLPTGAIAPSTRASGHEAGNAYVEFDLTGAIGVLHDDGAPHTLAIEVHQQAASSSDLVLDAELVAWVDEPPPSGGPGSEIIPGATTWRLWDQGGSPGADWNQPGHDESSWTSSRHGPFGFGEPYINTTLTAGHVTYYFRTEIDVDVASELTSMNASVMYDDGFVMYVNGHEVLRRSMPAGAVSSTTLSTGHEAGNVFETFDLTAAKQYLVEGTNVIAVEVHQVAASSSDLVFELALDTDYRRVRNVIAPGSSWRYYDGPGEAEGDCTEQADEHLWRLGDCHEGGPEYPSAPGPLGYGESYLATTIGYGPDASHKHMTAYFMGGFSLPATDDDAELTSMFVDVMYDDGFVLYLNGTEALRVGMPAGEVTPTTAALGHETGPHYERFDLTPFADLLEHGSASLAVEVHQAAPTSSDLTFDLSLTTITE